MTEQEAAITAEETAIEAAAVKIDNSALNGVSLLSTSIAFTTNLDGGLSTFGAAAGIVLAETVAQH